MPRIDKECIKRDIRLNIWIYPFMIILWVSNRLFALYYSVDVEITMSRAMFEFLLVSALYTSGLIIRFVWRGWIEW